MQEVLQFFTGDNIATIITAIGGIITAPYFVNHFNQEKQWRYLSEKSSSEKFHKYFMKIFLFGLAFSFLIFALIMFWVGWFKIILSINVVGKICGIIMALVYILLVIFGETENDLIIFRKKCKHEKIWKTLFEKAPIVLFGIFWAGIWLQHNLIMRIVFSVVFIFEIIYLVVLDNERKSKYQYAKFYFYQGEPICNVDASNIRQDGKWIICVDKNSDKEYRFRVSDIQKVEYNERFNGETKICLPN